MNWSKLETLHGELILYHMITGSPTDFLNFIQVNKKFKYLLERLRLNPIPLTKETKKLFPNISHQQIFGDKNGEELEGQVRKEGIKVLMFNYEMSYSEYLEEQEEAQEEGIEIKCRKVVYTEKDRKKFGSIIPNEINILGSWCFSKSDMTSIIIPTTITEIQCHCFSNCKRLQEIILPDTVVSIGNNCFEYCSSLTQIQLSTILNCLNRSLFSRCSSLEQIIIPENVTFIDNEAFKDCNQLKELIIENDLHPWNIFSPRIQSSFSIMSSFNC